MLYELWRAVAAARRDNLALLDAASGRRWTFGELFAEAESWQTERSEVTAPGSAGVSPANSEAASLKLAGETPALPGRDTLAFPQGHSPEFILTVLAAWRDGKVVCPLEAGQAPPLSGRDALPRVPADPQISTTTLPASGIVHLKSTSATTGTPRCVAFTAEQLAADAESIVATMGLRSDWPNLGVISLAHSYGFSSLITPLLLHGIPLVLASAPLPESVRRAAAFVPEITLPAVPAMWRAWHDGDSIPPNVKLGISAGAPLPLALEQEIFAKRGLKIHNFYGASECGGIAYDASETPRINAACVGSPMKNVLLSVAGDGCLEVRSRAIAETYWPQADANLGDGCFHTSDLAELSGGQVYLLGRAGDQINVAGRKVLPQTIEGALLRHPQVSECLIFGVPSRDAERTEEIVAVVVFDSKLQPPPETSPSPHSEAWGEGRGEGLSHGLISSVPEQTVSSPLPSPPREERECSFQEREEVLRRFASEALPAWQTPRHWWFVEALPASARGKVSRAEWRERWLATKKSRERAI